MKTRVAAAILAALGLLAMAAGVPVLARAVPSCGAMTAVSRAGDEAVLEVALIDEAFASYGSLGFHVASGADGYLYVVAMEEREFSSRFAALARYTREGGDYPGRVKLRGVVYEMPNELAAAASDYWGEGDSAFLQRFGTLFLNGASRPHAPLGWGLSGGGLLLVSGAVFLELHRRRKKAAG